MKFRMLAPSLALAAALYGPATAAVYVGNWDPPYGAPFASDLGWRGTAGYFVPDSCEPTGTALVNNATACSGAAVVTNAKVELYDINGPRDLLATIVFSPGSMTVSNLFYVGGNLDQLDTVISGLVEPVAESGVDLGDYGIPVGFTSFGLQFTSSGPGLHFQTCLRGRDCVSGVNNGTDFPPEFSITRVPEPASIALSGLALAALAAPVALRRRRGLQRG